MASPCTRGTLQTVFGYTPYDELVRLGLRPETQELARRERAELTGMLVVREVQPGSPTEGKLQPGDILTHVNGRLVTTFEPLDEIVDSSVGRTIDVTVERGGERVEQQLTVGDLHAITPSAYLEFGDAVVHTLSYQMARHFNAPVRGVFVANPGYTLEFGGCAARCRDLERRRQAGRSGSTISRRSSPACRRASEPRCAFRRSTTRKARTRA